MTRTEFFAPLRHPDLMTVLFMIAECILLAVGIWCLAQGMSQ